MNDGQYSSQSSSQSGYSEKPKAWVQLVEEIQNLYPQLLPANEAESAAKNLVTFYQTLLAIKKRVAQNPSHEQRH